ncbi:hypothetical protein D1872_325400 [compost metagenome]
MVYVAVQQPACHGGPLQYADRRGGFDSCFDSARHDGGVIDAESKPQNESRDGRPAVFADYYPRYHYGIVPAGAFYPVPHSAR